MRSTPEIYFQSLNRRFTIMGAEKSLFFLNLGLSGAIALSAKFYWVMDITALMILLMGHAVGVLITRSDPMMKEIYLRHIRYKKYYPSLSGLQAKHEIPKFSVPSYSTHRHIV